MLLHFARKNAQFVARFYSFDSTTCRRHVCSAQDDTLTVSLAVCVSKWRRLADKPRLTCLPMASCLRMTRMQCASWYDACAGRERPRIATEREAARRWRARKVGCEHTAVNKQSTSLNVIPTEPTKARFSAKPRYRRSRLAVNSERRDLQKRKKRFWRCEHANHFKQNVTLCVWECNALA